MLKKPNLKQVLLAFFESHNKVELKAVYEHFSEPNEDIDRYMAELCAENWIKINKSYSHDGFNIKRPIVLRTEKTMYAQPKLFDIF